MPTPACKRVETGPFEARAHRVLGWSGLSNLKKCMLILSQTIVFVKYILQESESKSEVKEISSKQYNALIARNYNSDTKCQTKSASHSEVSFPIPCSHERNKALTPPRNQN